MERIHELFHTRMQALQYLQGILKAYPPAIFGTKLSVRQQRDGHWVCAGARFAR